MPTEREIEAAADALRIYEQGGRLLRPWEKLPKSTKVKWVSKARAALEAAEKVRDDK